MVPVPPPTYAGTERVIASLGAELHRRGHHVGLVAAGDSEVPYELIRSVDASLWKTGYDGDVASYMQYTAAIAWDAAPRFDIIHSHLENHTFLLARYAPVPVADHAPRPSRHGRHARAAGAVPRRPARRSQREPAPLAHRSELGRHDPSRPAARVDAVQEGTRQLPRVRGPGDTREGRSRRDRARHPGQDAAEDRGQGPRPAREGVLPQGRPAGDRRRHGGVPGRARPGGAGSAVCRRPSDRDARRVAGTLRPGGHRVDGDRDAGHRPTRGRPHRDGRARHHRFPRRRRERGDAGVRACPGARPQADPGVHAGALLTGADDRPVRGGLPPPPRRARDRRCRSRDGPRRRPRAPAERARIRRRRDRTSSPRFRSAPRAPRPARPHARARTQTPRPDPDSRRRQVSIST